MHRAFASYREFAPCEALREHVRAFFSFDPWANENPARRAVTREVLFYEGDSFCSPLFADGHVSIVFSFERACCVGGLWRQNPVRPNGKVIGPMSAVGSPSGGERSEMVGVYFHAAEAFPFTRVPACVLRDGIVDLEDLWGAPGSELATELNEANGPARIDKLESALFRRIVGARVSGLALDVPGLAAWVLRQQGRLTVQRLADAAGVSRQHLTRVFRDCLGVAPKLYCRLARFQSGLAYAGCGKNFDWAQVGVELGYADQSHMIADFREFSSLTPKELAMQQWFHPFIERARDSRRWTLSSMAQNRQLIRRQFNAHAFFQ
jgi:AraC-like DNA-binding protein